MGARPELSEAERLALLAHELRSPVAALDALAAAARAGGADRGALVRLAIEAGRDVERLVLDPDLGSVRFASLDLAPPLLALAAEDVEVEVEGRPVAWADGARVRQVLANLVANARRHGAAVTVTCRDAGDVIVIEIADDGPGLPTGLDPFARGASGSGSTGYGLWLGRRIALAHGGALEHVPARGPGARFRLVLPSASGAERDRAPAGAPSPAPRSSA